MWICTLGLGLEGETPFLCIAGEIIEHV